MSTRYNFSSKHVLVTGGSSGIGLATAELFAHTGAKVAVIDREIDNPELSARGLNCNDGHLIIPADVSSEREMESAFGAIRNTFGKLDVVIANAGINGTWAPITDLTVADWEMVMGVNLRGTFLTSRLSVPLLVVDSSIVIVSSINGTRTFTNSGATAYAASKAAQIAITKMLALELAEKRIRVNAVCPGATESDIEDNTERKNLSGIGIPVQFPQGDIPITGGTKAKAHEVSEVIAFLCSSSASHITGTELYVDGGQSLIL